MNIFPIFPACPNSESAIHVSKKRKTKDCMRVVVQSNNYSTELVDTILSNNVADDVLSSFEESFPTNSSFYQSTVQISHQKAIYIFINSINQNNDVWKKERRVRITGSICYELYTYCSNKQADWKKKVLKVFFSTFQGNAVTRYGVMNENVALKIYEKQNGSKTENCGLYVNPKLLWLGYSADSINVKENCLCEIKFHLDGKKMTATALLHHLPFLNCEADGCTSFKHNHKYYGQVQLGMMLLGLPKYHSIVYSSLDDSIAVLEVFYDDIFTKTMVKTLHSAYFNHILPILESIQM